MTASPPSVRNALASLPSTMSGLLEAATSEARRLDHSIYFPRYDRIHEAGRSTHCKVSLAGCLIAGRLDIPSDTTVTSLTFDGPTEDLLDALNCMRLGYWLKAFKLIHRRPPSGAIAARLCNIPNPLCARFYGWGEFNGHLDSLERLLPTLRTIDQQAAQL